MNLETESSYLRELSREIIQNILGHLHTSLYNSLPLTELQLTIISTENTEMLEAFFAVLLTGSGINSFHTFIPHKTFTLQSNI